jgi:hypothetical protein
VKTGIWIVMVAIGAQIAVSAQTPQPFPRPGSQTQKPAQPPPAPSTVAPPTAKPTQPAVPAAAVAPKPGEPTEATLGAPIYPSAVFLTSYDAGRGQRFYIYGVNAPYAEMVNYYRTVLKNRGDELFEAPPTHFFETARFRDETMAFPPSVTVKDYTYGGAPGYPSGRAGKTERFPTVIQIAAPPQ